MLNIDIASTTFDRTIQVRFAQPGGTVKTGSFNATFKRVSKDRIDEFVDTANGFSISEVLDEVLAGVSGIGRATAPGEPPQELPADQQIAWVRNSPEASAAAFNDFFAAMRQDSGAGKTSKKPR